MTRSRVLPRLALTMMTLGIVLGAYFSFVRPWFRSWGATRAEVVRPLPGDEIVPDADADTMTTRAITIHAAIASVWPWLAQLGQDRGGFYSFEVLEDLVGCEMANTDRIHPEFQAWKPGDKLWMYPPTKLHGMGHAPLVRYEDGRVLAFATWRVGSAPPAPYAGSWAFVLEPINANTTRFLVRGRPAPGRSVPGALFDRFVFEPVHFVMERKTMEGIALRAEGGRGSKATDTVQVLLWTATFALFVLAGASAVRRARWTRPLAAFAAAAIVFQVLTLLQPSIALGIPLVAAVALLLWLPWPSPAVGGLRPRSGVRVELRALKQRAVTHRRSS
jgi:hypothetical protein